MLRHGPIASGVFASSEIHHFMTATELHVSAPSVSDSSALLTVRLGPGSVAVDSQKAEATQHVCDCPSSVISHMLQQVGIKECAVSVIDAYITLCNLYNAINRQIYSRRRLKVLRETDPVGAVLDSRQYRLLLQSLLTIWRAYQATPSDGHNVFVLIMAAAAPGSGQEHGAKRLRLRSGFEGFH